MIESDFEPIRVELTRSEYARGMARCRELAKRFAAERSFSPRLVNIVWLCALPVLLAIGIKTFDAVSVERAWIFFAALLAYATFTVWVTRSGIHFRTGPLETGPFLRPYTITVAEDGLHFAWEVADLRLGWGAVLMVDHEAGLILIVVDRGAGYIVPRRVFPDKATANRFVTHLISKLDREAFERSNG